MLHQKNDQAHCSETPMDAAFDDGSQFDLEGSLATIIATGEAAEPDGAGPRDYDGGDLDPSQLVEFQECVDTATKAATAELNTATVSHKETRELVVATHEVIKNAGLPQDDALTKFQSELETNLRMSTASHNAVLIATTAVDNCGHQLRAARTVDTALSSATDSMDYAGQASEHTAEPRPATMPCLV